jgi:hypothetical protein
MHDLSADIEIPHATEAQPDPTGHLLLHGDLAGNVEFAGKALLHAKQTA